MELLEVFYRRKLRKKQKKAELGQSDGALCRSPSEASVNSLATGLISRVLRFTSRRTEHTSRPHSWHSTKLGDGQQDVDLASMDTMSSTWQYNYHPSVSTTDLSGAFDTGGAYLRKSPDQYSSRGSMDSLDPPLSSQHHSGAQHHHPLVHHIHSGAHPTYSSCHQLSSARSSNSIDHLHSKRDSAYSSFSTSSSIPEYLASPSFNPERSCSLETVSHRGGGSGDMQLSEMRYVRAMYDGSQAVSQERELGSASNALRGSAEGARLGLHRDPQGGVCYRASSSSSSSGSGSGAAASKRHSVGPIWGPAASHSSYESLKGAPPPPRRSDSYAATRNHERPNSWSSLENARSLRSLQKGSWHHSSGCVASAKGSYSAEGQLHTVIEKSPESSPTTKPRQGGGFPQPPSLSQPSPGPAGHIPQSGRIVYPTGMYPVPHPEPHYGQISTAGPGFTGLYPTPAKESGRHLGPRDEGGTEGRRDGRVPAPENGYQMNPSSSYPYSSPSTSSASQRRSPAHEAERSMDLSSTHSEPIGFSRLPQELARPAAPPACPSSHRLGDSVAAAQHQDHRERDRDRDHPLTRLEIALAEVQRCTSPDSVASGQGSRSSGDYSQGPARHLSVLEKVSRFERRDHAGKQRSTSSTSSTSTHSKSSQLRMTEKGRTASYGADDLRTMLERSTNPTKAHRTLSYRGSTNERMKNRNEEHRTPADPASALQRSRSSYHVQAPREGESSRELPWRHDIQEMLGSAQDTAFDKPESSRFYRDCLKDTQSKVLRSTSLGRRDQSSPVGPPPPAPSSTSGQPQPALAQHSPEKKGPKTMPKPQGIIILPQSPPPLTSPHTPKERHVVSPDTRGPSPPPLPSVPPVGAPPLTRICGRRRLAAEQKKRSYSEPENMNDVGVSDPETAALFRLRGETSVADRRRMFELAASRITDGGQNAISRPELRQIQQDALAEYVERKRGVRKSEGGQRSVTRPRSAYVQPDNNTHTVSYSHSDTLSLSSSSSLLSLQDSGGDRSVCSREGRLCSILAPDSDLHSLQSNLFYPGRVTTPRPPVPAQTSAPPGPFPELQAQHDQPGPSRHQGWVQQQPAPEPPLSLGVSPQLNGVLQRAGSACSSGRSASAEDLLERLQERQSSPHRSRSQSSPTGDRLNQDLPPGDVRMFGVFMSTPGRHSLAEARAVDVQASGGLLAPQLSRNSPNSVQSAGPSQNVESSPHPAAPRRERHRHGERQRASSTSTLAASVGLPCPFSPGGGQDGPGAAWDAGQRPSRAGLGVMAFPGPETSCVPQEDEEAPAAASPSAGRDGGSTASSPPPPPPQQHLSSLRISESSLFGCSDLQQPEQPAPSLEDLDEVFLQSPALPFPPPPPIRETSITEDFPPPPPPVELEEDDEQTTGRVSGLPSSPAPPPLASAGPADGLDPSRKPQACPAASGSAASSDEASLNLDYQPLCQRDKTREELRAEALARQLVQQDSSLAHLLDTWGGKSTIEFMMEIFPNSKSVRTSPVQSDHRLQDGVGNPVPNPGMGREKEARDEEDLNSKKVELCDALRSSVLSLRQEREALCEEQSRHQALGSSVHALVQERLKANERDKYSMFMGDLERIVHLLLSLCSRMARIDRSLLALEREELSQEAAAEERDCLQHKRSLLLSQTDDARELKENLERRQRAVQSVLRARLSAPQLQDYRRFVGAKPSLLIRQRHLDDLIRRGEEQLARLSESLPQDVLEARGWSRAGLLSAASPAPCSSPFLLLLPPPVSPGPVHSVRSTTVTSL